MNLGIYPVRMNNSSMTVRKEAEPQKPVENVPAFQGMNKPLRRVGYGLVAAALLGIGVSCSHSSSEKSSKGENIENVSGPSVEDVNKSAIEGSKRVLEYRYHLNMGDTVLPDGTKVKAEMFGNDLLITRKNPDGSKVEITDYSHSMSPVDRKYRQDTYSPNGKLREEKHFCSYVEPEFGIVNEKYYTKYNEKGQLLYWQDNVISEHDCGENEEKYDKQGRLITSWDGSTQYFYKGDSEEAYKSIETRKGCQHVIIYGEGGALCKAADYGDNILEEYFIAKDGTKTDASVLNEIKW